MRHAKDREEGFSHEGARERARCFACVRVACHAPALAKISRMNDDKPPSLPRGGTCASDFPPGISPRRAPGGTCASDFPPGVLPRRAPGGTCASNFPPGITRYDDKEIMKSNGARRAAPVVFIVGGETSFLFSQTTSNSGLKILLNREALKLSDQPLALYS
jgi:hypothetical protein